MTAPLLDGALGRRARAAAEAIAEDLRRTPRAYDFGADQAIGLGDGDAGVAVLYACLGDLAPRWRRVARARLSRALAGAAAARLDASLHAGFPGLAWAVDHVGARLGAPADATAGVEALVCARLKGPARGRDPGLLFGVAGLAFWATERPGAARAPEARAIVRALAACADRRAHGAAWRRPDPPPELAARFPGGAWDTSIATGTAGVVLALARLADAGLGGAVGRALLVDGARWLAAQRTSHGDGAVPAFVGVHGGELAAPPSWTKGELGVAVALFAAARITGEVALRARALELARRVAAIDPSASPDASLARGAAGVGHVLSRLAAHTDEVALRRGAIAWFARALALRRPGRGIGGFRLAGMPAGPAARHGVLLGAAGIALALLSASTDLDPGWDRMLGGTI